MKKIDSYPSHFSMERPDVANLQKKNIIAQPSKDLEDLARSYYQRISDLRDEIKRGKFFEVTEYPEKYGEGELEEKYQIPKKTLRVDTEKMKNIFQELNQLEEEIRGNSVLKIDSQVQGDMLRKINFIRNGLFQYLDVMSWPVGFIGDQRREEEQKARDFLVECYFQLAEKKDEGNDEKLNLRRKSSLNDLLNKITLPLYRAKMKEYGGKFRLGWIGGPDPEKLFSKLEPWQARLLSERIYEYADLAAKRDEELEELFYTDKKRRTLGWARMEFFRKAASTLNRFGKALLGEDLSGEKDPNENLIKNMLAELSKSSIEIEIMASMLKAAKQEGNDIEYSQIKNLELEEKEIGLDLEEKEKREIIDIARENYFGDIFKDNPEAAQRVIGELEEELFGADGLKNQRTYILKYQGHTIAFCRFKPIEGKPGHLYAGSLNIYKDLRGLSLGGYFVQATVGKESKNYVLHAITRENNPANESYKKCGWTIDYEHPFEKNGARYFDMVMDRREKK